MSLVVQLLRVCFLWSGKIPHATGQLSLWAAAAETHIPRACALQQEKPSQWEAHTSTTRESPQVAKKDSVQPKIKN